MPAEKSAGTLFPELHGARHLRPTDADFPSELRDLTDQLWLRGQPSALRVKPRITIVGSRAASARGRERARALGRALGQAGALVISGGALGIDGAAHEGALEAAGRTCAVLGTGVDLSYPPRHADLFEAITRQGCLLSMLELGAPPHRAHFPQRNVLMAALADVVIVVEAQLRSGTEWTARAARKLGRPIFCFPDSPGTAALVGTGATPLASAVEALGLLGLSGPDRASDESATCGPLPPLSDAARALASILMSASSPLDLGELCARSRLATAECAAVLIDLELRGQCSRLPGGRYIGHSPLS